MKNSVKNINNVSEDFEIDGTTLVKYKGSSREVVIPDYVTVIGEYAFADLYNLTSVTISSSVKIVCGGAFSNCVYLWSIKFNGTTEQFFAIDFRTSPVLWCENTPEGVIFCTDGELEKHATYSNESVGNTDGFEIMGSALMRYNGDGGDVVVPSGVVFIGNMAFNCCDKITSVVISDGVTHIDSLAFNGCSNLKSVTLPNSVAIIGDGAFSECGALTGINVPAGVKKIGTAAFAKCNELAEITVDGENAVYYSEGNCLIEKESKTLVTGCSSSVIPKGVKRIADCAFYGCKKLTNIAIPDGVTSIGHYAFSYCRNLENVSIPESVTEIGCGKFDKPDCWGSIGDEHDFIDGDYGRNSDGSMWCSIMDWGGESGCGVFTGCDKLTSVVVPRGVTVIGNRMFACCKALASVSVPDGVTSIGTSAFYDCEALNDIAIPSGVKHIGDYAFDGCKKFTCVTVPSGVTRIGNHMFAGCKAVTSIIIPDTVTSIGASAFYGCVALKNLVIPRGVTSIGDWAFDRSGVTDMIIPKNVTTIGEGMFFCCEKLTSIVIPDSVTSIGHRAFYGCYDLTSVYYMGTAENWDRISIDYNEIYDGRNDYEQVEYEYMCLDRATRYYYSESKPKKHGNYWHYDKDGVTPVVW